MNISLGKHFEKKAKTLANWRGINSVSAYIRSLIARDFSNYEGSQDAHQKNIAEILQRSKKRNQDFRTPKR